MKAGKSVPLLAHRIKPLLYAPEKQNSKMQAAFAQDMRKLTNIYVVMLPEPDKHDKMLPKTEDRRPKTVSRLAGAAVLYIAFLLLSSVSTKAATDYTVWAGQIHTQNTSISFNTLSLDGTNASSLAPVIQIAENIVITIIDQLYVEMPTRNAWIQGEGYLNTTAGGTLTINVKNPYVSQNQSSGLVIDGVRIRGNLHLIKNGQGVLQLQNSATHQLDSLTINTGGINLVNSLMSVTEAITLRANTFLQIYNHIPESNPLLKTGGGLPKLKLIGNANDQAELRLIGAMNGTPGSLHQGLEELYIENRGLVDFGTYSSATNSNILYLDQLSFNDADAILTIRNWEASSDYLLVNKSWGDSHIASLLSQIYFEGYGFAQSWETHGLSDFSGYWKITPFPEPTTYGAILGTVGLGLVVWRRRRLQSARNHSRAHDRGRLVD